MKTNNKINNINNKYSNLSAVTKSLYKNYSYMFHNDHYKYTPINFIYMNKQANGKLFLLKAKKRNRKKIYRAYRFLNKRFIFSFNKSKQKYNRLISSRFNIKETINPYLITFRARHLVRLLEHKVMHNISSFYSVIRPISLLKKAKQKKRSFYVRNYSLYNNVNKNKNINNINKNIKTFFYVLRYFSPKKIKRFYNKILLRKKIRQKNKFKYKKKTQINLKNNNTLKLQKSRINIRNSFSKKLLNKLYVRRHLSLYKFKIKVKSFNFFNINSNNNKNIYYIAVKLRKQLNTRFVNDKVQKKITILRTIYNRIRSLDIKIKQIKKNSLFYFYNNHNLNKSKSKKQNSISYNKSKKHLKKRKLYHSNFRYRVGSPRKVFLKIQRVNFKINFNKNKNKYKNNQLEKSKEQEKEKEKLVSLEKIKSTVESFISRKKVSINYKNTKKKNTFKIKTYNNNYINNNYKGNSKKKYKKKYRPFLYKSKVKSKSRNRRKIVGNKFSTLVNLVRFRKYLSLKIKKRLVILCNIYKKNKTLITRLKIKDLKDKQRKFIEKYKSFLQTYPKRRPRKFRDLLQKITKKRKKHFYFKYSKQHAKVKRFAISAPFSLLKSKKRKILKKIKSRLKLKSKLIFTLKNKRFSIRTRYPRLRLRFLKQKKIKNKNIKVKNSSFSLSNSLLLRNFFLPIFSFEKQKKRLGSVKLLTRLSFSKKMLLVLKKIKKIIEKRKRFRTIKRSLQPLLPFNFARKSKAYYLFVHPAFSKKKKFHLSRKFIRFKLRKRKLKIYFQNKDKKSGGIKKELSSDYARHLAFSVTKYNSFHLKQKYKRLKKIFNLKKAKESSINQLNLKNKNNNTSKKLKRKKKNVIVKNTPLYKFLYKRFNINKKTYLKEKQIYNADKYYYYSLQKILNKTIRRNISKTKKRLYRQTSYFKSYRYRRHILSHKKNVISNYSYVYNPQKKIMEHIKVDNYATVKQPYKFGNIYIRYAYNNSFMCLSDKKNRVITKVSGGSKEYKGKKRATPYSKERVARTLSTRALSLNYKVIDIHMQNSHYNHNYHVRKGFSQSRLFIRKVEVHQKTPHGYVRLKKPRRI